MPEINVIKDNVVTQTIFTESYLVLYTEGDRVKFAGDMSLKFLLSAIPINRIMEVVGVTGRRQ